MAHQGHKEVTEKRDALQRAAHFAPAEGNEESSILHLSNIKYCIIPIFILPDSKT